jgi:serine/threonine protein kinase
VRDFYDVLEVLGEGSFSTVYLAESLAERGGYAAIKVIQKTDLMKTKKIPEVHKR